MKVSNTSARLKTIMQERRLRQVDILNAAKPFCAQYGIKLEKNDLSQYVSGKVEPKQEKLTILGLALDVNEAWLMGYDVSMTRTPDSPPRSIASDEDIQFALFGGADEITEKMFDEVKQFAAFLKQREGYGK